MRPRFSLRTLLVLTALIAAGCYWWIARPTIVAEQFIAAIRRTDYASAESLLVDEREAYASAFAQCTAQEFDLSASLTPRRWGDTWRGRRRIDVIVSYPSMNGSVTSSRELSDHLHFTASPLGIRPPEPYWMLFKGYHRI